MGLNPPPSADSAASTGGRDTGDLGVVGKVQSHLITSYFHARPRKQLPVHHTAGLHASQQASLPSSAAAAPPSVKLATQQNPATGAEATTQRNSPAAHLLANSPGSQQWAANPLTSPPTGETISSEAEPDVQEQTGANQPGEDGRQYLRDILPCVVHRPPGHRTVTGGRRPAPPDPHRPVCLSQGHLLEDNPRQALHPPPEPPDLSQHDLPAAPVDVDSDQHDGNCPGSKPHARFHGRGNSHSPEKESIDRITE